MELNQRAYRMIYFALATILAALLVVVASTSAFADDGAASLSPASQDATATNVQDPVNTEPIPAEDATENAPAQGQEPVSSSAPNPSRANTMEEPDTSMEAQSNPTGEESGETNVSSGEDQAPAPRSLALKSSPRSAPLATAPAPEEEEEKYSSNVSDDEVVGAWEVTNIDSNKNIDVKGNSKDNGTPIIVYAQNGGTNQKWDIQSAGEGYYYLVSAISGKLIDVANSIAEVGKNLIQWKPNGGDNQKWSIIKTGSNYSFITKLDNMALSYLDSNLILSAFNGTPTSDQLFRLKDAQILNEGTYSISHVSNSQKVIDVNYAGMGSAGVSVYQYGQFKKNQIFDFIRVGKNIFEIRAAHSGHHLAADSNGNVYQSASSNKQQWRVVVNGLGFSLVNANGGTISFNGNKVITKDDFSTGAAKLQMNIKQAQLIKNGMYQIRTGSTSGKLGFDVANNSAANNAKLILYTLSSSISKKNQKFNITHLGNGVYKIVNVNSGKAVTIDSNGYIIQNGTGSVVAQQWIARVGAGGSVIFVNKGNGMAISLNGSAASGAYIRSSSASEASGERWYLTTTTILKDYQQRAVDKATARGSASNFYFVCNLTNHRFVVLKRANKDAPWELYADWPCTTGRIEKGRSLTPTGDGRITGGTLRVWHDINQTWTTYYRVSWGKNYFHDRLFYYNSNKLMDGAMGVNHSSGCIRLMRENIKWIYNNAGGILLNSGVTVWK